MDENKFKIFIFALPGTGHINPLYPIICELSKQKNLQTIVYLSSDFKSRFDSIGVEMREMKLLDLKIFQSMLNSSHNDPTFAIKFFIDVAQENMERVCQEISTEKPDLIIYDMVSMYFKWFINYYNKWYDICQKTPIQNRSKLKFAPEIPLPPLVGFSPAFLFNKNVYPNNFERSMLMKFSFSMLWGLIKSLYYTFRFSFKFGIKFTSPTDMIPLELDSNHKFAFASLLADIQPRAEMFDQKKYKFVGATFDEDKLELLSEQEPFVSLFSNLKQNEKLIYISLGSLFNNSLKIYQIILESLEKFEQKDLKILISVGQETINKLELMKSQNKIRINENVILVKMAPQISVLKRASLFVTHSGMNSTSESIHFGVPMVCLPCGADQPLVAYRVADELGLGIKLDPNKMNSKDLYEAMNKVLNDQIFLERVKKFSIISQSTKGSTNACKLILNSLKNKN